MIPLPTPSEFDLKLIEKCDPSVRKRRLIEIAVVRHACAELVKNGYAITVDDGGDQPVKFSTDIDSIVDAAFSVDDCVFHVSEGRLRRYFGWIRLVFGNDGWDVINDHTTNLEEVLKATTEYAEQLSEWC